MPISTVYRALGRALWITQAFENTLAYYLTMTLKLAPDVAEEEARAILERTQKKTLGQLLRLCENTEMSTKVEDRLEHFLQERNWLIHRSWRECSTDILNETRRSALLERIDGISDQAKHWNAEFLRLLKSWCERRGMDMREVDRHARDMLHEWLGAYAEPKDGRPDRRDTTGKQEGGQ